jgi:hypothetical protein
MGVNTLPPGAPRSSSILGLGQGIRSERVNSLHRRQGDRVFSRASRPRGPDVHSQRADRRGQRFVHGLGCPGLVHRVSNHRTCHAGIWEQMHTDPESTSCPNYAGVQDHIARVMILLTCGERSSRFRARTATSSSAGASSKHELRSPCQNGSSRKDVSILGGAFVPEEGRRRSRWDWDARTS